MASSLSAAVRSFERLANAAFELRARRVDGGHDALRALVAQPALQRRQQRRGAASASVTALVATKASSSRHAGRRSAVRSCFAEPVALSGHGEDQARLLGRASSFSRRWRMWTSIARGSRYAESPRSRAAAPGG